MGEFVHLAYDGLACCASHGGCRNELSLLRGVVRMTFSGLGQVAQVSVRYDLEHL